MFVMTVTPTGSFRLTFEMRFTFIATLSAINILNWIMLLYISLKATRTLKLEALYGSICVDSHNANEIRIG